MFQVKKFERGEVLIQTRISIGVAGYKAPHDGWGIVNSNGDVVIQPGKAPEFYQLKQTAVLQCEWLNEQNS